MKNRLSRNKAVKRLVEAKVTGDRNYKCIAKGHYVYKGLLYVYLNERKLRVSLFSSHYTFYYSDIRVIAMNELLDGYCKKVIEELREVSREKTLVSERRKMLTERDNQNALF